MYSNPRYTSELDGVIQTHVGNSKAVGLIQSIYRNLIVKARAVVLERLRLIQTRNIQKHFRIITVYCIYETSFEYLCSNLLVNFQAEKSFTFTNHQLHICAYNQQQHYFTQSQGKDKRNLVLSQGQNFKGKKIFRFPDYYHY